MDDCTKHPREIVGLDGSIDELVASISALQYDVAVSFLEKLGREYHRQAEADEGRGRNRLASELYHVGGCFLDAADAYAYDKGESLDVPLFQGSLDELVAAIGDLQYDVTTTLLDKLAVTYHHRAASVAEKLYDAREAVGRAWDICEPYMR
ncbi:hypothetical protein GF367_03580 [Candidatus Woesearchaeota archaeon]|nr:hypothetical protein [Candidatus Woesearchaeota archaeon]